MPEGGQIITGYGPGLFRIAGVAHGGSVLVLPDRTLPWAVMDFAEIDMAGLAPIMAQNPSIDVLLLGCGPTMQLPSRDLRGALRAQGIVLEPMDTGAACRTYNVLLTEGRRAAAALIALPGA
ncbi:MAG: Mth938-like domain-containing protein [Alphaproteobacteria bacterium]|nr:Mth938-like domain-containing protein [Alphaproteobacteria bacterium]